MIKESVFVKLFINLFLIFKTVRYSFIYRVLKKCKDNFFKLFSGSFIYRFFKNEDKIEKYSSNSKIINFVDKILAGIVGFLRKIYGYIRKINRESINNFLYKFINKNSRFCFHNITGFFIVIMAIIPGDRWNNLYSLMMAMILLFVYVLVIASGKDYNYSIKKFDFIMAIYMLATVLGVAVSYSVMDSIRVFMFFVTSFIFMIVISGSIKDIKTLEKVVGFVITGLVLTSLYCIYQGIKGVEIDMELVDMTANAGMPGRAYSTFENPNNYAEYLVMFIPFMAAFMLNRKKNISKTVGIIMILIPFAALLYTYSRSCWVSFAISAIVFIAFYNYKLLPVMAILGIMCIPFLPQTIINRIFTIGSMKDTSNQYRILIWDGVLKMLKNCWVTGIGLGPSAFSKLYPSFAHTNAVLAPHSHMLFMQILTETGILGFLSFGIYWVVTLKRLVTAKINSMSKELKNYLCASLSSLTGIIFVSGVEYIWFYPRVMFMFFIMIGLIMATLNIAKRG